MEDIRNAAVEIRTLKAFYSLMEQTREVRRGMVAEIFNETGAQRIERAACIKALHNALESLKSIPASPNTPASATKKTLAVDANKQVDVDLGYEITETQKDLLYLEQGEEALLEFMREETPNFDEQVNILTEKFKGMNFRAFITDRDGTVNNYCGRYRSSIQSIYNAVFLSRFAHKAARFPVFITSAPLRDGGIVDISVNPADTFIYAASKGRECIDLSGNRRSFPIEQEKQQKLDALNKELGDMVTKPENEIFSLIGSGLQMKFGQTTIARQDINESVTPQESQDFLDRVTSLVRSRDPDEEFFRIEDTGLDIEIILTVSDQSGGGLKDFDKADGVRYLNKEFDMGMQQGPHLICGDTGSDVPMAEAALEFSKETHAVFVTQKPDLQERVRALGDTTTVVDVPDVLVSALGMLGK